MISLGPLTKDLHTVILIISLQLNHIALSYKVISPLLLHGQFSQQYSQLISYNLPLRMKHEMWFENLVMFPVSVLCCMPMLWWHPVITNNACKSQLTTSLGSSPAAIGFTPFGPKHCFPLSKSKRIFHGIYVKIWFMFCKISRWCFILFYLYGNFCSLDKANISCYC